jgi:hypothetical protein
MPSISFMPLSIYLTAIRRLSASIPNFKMRPVGGRHRYEEMLECNNVLIDVVLTLRVGNVLDLLIFVSDGKRHSNFAGETKEWPVHTAIGNLLSKIRQMPSTHIILMVTLLPIPI